MRSAAGASKSRSSTACTSVPRVAASLGFSGSLSITRKRYSSGHCMKSLARDGDSDDGAAGCRICPQPRDPPGTASGLAHGGSHGDRPYGPPLTAGRIPSHARRPGALHDRADRRPRTGARDASDEGTPWTTAGSRSPAAASGPARPAPEGRQAARAHAGPGGGILMGRPFGVPVYVAPSWFLVAALITWVFGGQLDRVLPELGAARYLVSLFFAVAFYASVLVHELAHTVAALRFKLPVRRIQLQFFGGVSEIEKESETPGREFVLAFVGPLLSLVLAGVFYLGMLRRRARHRPRRPARRADDLQPHRRRLQPAARPAARRRPDAARRRLEDHRQAHDRHRRRRLGRPRPRRRRPRSACPCSPRPAASATAPATSAASTPLTDALLAAILAAIIWTGAGNSLRMARLREHLPDLRARTLTRRAVPVESDTPLSEALRRANEAGARALVVVDGHGDPTALVREAAIVGVPEHRRPWVAVSGLAQDLTDGMTRLRRTGRRGPPGHPAGHPRHRVPRRRGDRRDLRRPVHGRRRARLRRRHGPPR